MITTVDAIRHVRPVAQNIDGASRIEPYIREAETLQILPSIGVEVYRWLDETDFSGDGPWTFIASDGRKAVLSKEQHEALLYGGYYRSEGGNGFSLGLAAAVSYYAYARAVLDNQVNVTAFGVVKKRSDFSEPVDAVTLTQVSRQALKLGDEALRGVVGHLQALGLTACAPVAKRLVRYMSVGRKKM